MKKLSLLDHLDELRSRLIIIFSAFIVFFFVGFYFSDNIIRKIIHDLVAADVNLVVISPVEYILSQIKVAFIISLIIVFPLLLFECIRFTRPALKRNELLGIELVLPSFIILILLGILFGYYVFLRIALKFLANLTSYPILNFWSLSKLISFIAMSCLCFGIIFLIPLLLLLLFKLKIISKKSLKKNRKYVYVISFIVAALISPPDAITQVLIAVPIIILYEISILLIRIL